MEELYVIDSYLYLLLGIIIVITICYLYKQSYLQIPYNINFGKSDCVICLCCRDVEPYLHKIFLNLQRLESLFSTTQIVFFYDQSKDNTLKLLYDYKQRFPNIHIIENQEPLLKYRTHRIAYGRNKLLDYMNTHFNDYEYFIMMDCDDVCINPIKTDIIDKYLNRNDWDSLSFNRIGYINENYTDYYDIWALQYEPFLWDCWGFGKLSSNVTNIMKQDIMKKLHNLEEDELFPCISAFNGFAIYRKHKFNNCKYNGDRINKLSINEYHELKEYMDKLGLTDIQLHNLTTENTPETCEHISFHKEAIKYNGAKIKISKNTIF